MTATSTAGPEFGSMGHHDFSNMVLYVDPADKNSSRAMQYAAGIHDVHVQSIHDLPRPLPAWLTGVPTIVEKNSGRAHRGTACIKLLDGHARGNWSGVAGATGVQGAGFIGGFDGGAPMACGATSVFHAGADAEDTSGDHQAGQALPPRMASQPSTRIGKSEVDAYMLRRG